MAEPGLDETGTTFQGPVAVTLLFTQGEKVRKCCCWISCSSGWPHTMPWHTEPAFPADQTHSPPAGVLRGAATLQNSPETRQTWHFQQPLEGKQPRTLWARSPSQILLTRSSAGWDRELAQGQQPAGGYTHPFLKERLSSCPLCLPSHKCTSQLVFLLPKAQSRLQLRAPLINSLSKLQPHVFFLLGITIHSIYWGKVFTAFFFFGMISLWEHISKWRQKCSPCYT